MSRATNERGVPSADPGREPPDEQGQMVASYKRLLLEAGERIKELDCINSVAAVCQSQSSLEELFRRVISLVPAGWHCPDTTYCTVKFDGHEYSTGPVEGMPCKRSSDIVVKGETRGVIEVHCMDAHRCSGEGPSLQAKQRVLDAIARSLGVAAERIEAEKGLRESEARYAALVEHIPAVSYSVTWRDDRNAVRYVSPQIERLLGYTQEEWASDLSVWRALLHPDDRERVLAELDRHWHAGDKFSIEYRMLARDGRTVWLHDEADWVRDESAGSLTIHGVALDITERKQAEEAARAERQRFNDVVDQLPGYLVLLTPDCHVPFANRLFRERFGEPQGRRCYEYLFGRTAPCEMCDVDSVLKTKAPQRHEWTSPDGRNYDICDFPFTDVDGSTLIMEVGLDITEHKRAEAELEKHRQHLDELVQERTRQLAAANAQLQAEIAERKRTEEAMRTEHNLVASILQASPAAITVLDSHGRITFANFRAEQVLGLSRSDITGRTYDDPRWRITNFDGALYPTEALPFARVMASGQPAYGVQHAIEWPDGKRKLLSINAAPLLDAEGQCCGMVAAIEDITEAARIQQTLRESQERFQFVAHATNDVIWDWDRSTNRVWWSDAIRSLVGGPVDEVTDVTWWEERIHPEDRERVLSREPRGHIISDEYRFRRADGSYAHVYDRGYVVRDAAGKPVRMIGAIADLTDAERAKEELRRSELKYRTLFERARDAILVLDAGNQTILEANDRACELFGLSKEQLGEMNIRQLTNEVVCGEPEDCLLLRGGACPNCERTYNSATGRRIDMLASSCLIEYDGKPAILSINRDITERKQAEEVLRRRGEELATVLDILPAIVWVGLDPEGSVITGNRAANELTGTAAGTNVSQKAAAAGQAVYLKQLKEDGSEYRVDELPMQRAIALGEPVRDAEIRFCLPDGRQADVFGHAAPLFDAQGQVRGAVAAFTDITERKRAEHQVRKRMNELQVLYGFAGIAQRQGITLDKLYQEVTDILPKGWQHTEIACARIVIGDSEFRTKNFAECRWTQSAPIKVHESVVGKIEVGYLEEESTEDEGPFLKEERLVIDAMAERLGHVTEEKQAEREMRKLSGRLLRVQDEERRRLARDLHDSTAQNLSVLKMNLSLLDQAPEKSEIVAQSITIADQCLREVRTVSYSLHPPLLDELGLPEALTSYIEGFGKRTGIDIRLDLPPGMPRLSSDIETSVFRIVQECLMNVHCHSASTTATVYIRLSPAEILLSVEDRGGGMLPATLRKVLSGWARLGVGIAGMRERATQLGGRLEIESTARGTVVKAALPLEEEGT